MAKLDSVVAKYTRVSEEIAKLLKEDGFIADYSIENSQPTKKIILTLRYFDKNLPAITGIKRVSKSSVRIYSGFNKIPAALSGAGTTIVSTSAGLMTGKTAKEKHLGGEIICQIW